MEATNFKTVAQSLLTHSIFADYTIKSGEKEYKVHSAILSCHSAYFKKCFQGNYKESESKVIELKEDDAEAIDLMMGYLYAFDYNDKPKPDAKLTNEMFVNTAVYAIADKYEVLGLKLLASKKFGVAVGQAFQTKQGICAAIPLVYDSTPPSDRGLRDICVDLWMLGAVAVETANDREAVTNLFQAVPQLGADIAIRLAKSAAKGFAMNKCSCHSNICEPVPEACEAMRHRWNDKEDVSFAARCAVPQFWLAK